MSLTFDKCTDVNLIFEGGQKKVYRATHNNYGLVAIKVGEYSSIAQLERIKREVACLKEIDSKYFPKNYDFLVNTSERKFTIIEEYIVSKNLTDLKMFFNTEEKIINLLKELIRGMKVLWDKNIVHRDLKPDNILITEDYTPKIIDLGIARFLDNDDLTRTLAPMGPCTPIYASPEQILNQKEIIDIRTDFFLLGVIILELHLGVHPFQADVVGNMNSIPVNICNGIYIEAKTKSGTTSEFNFLINKMLKVQPFNRFKNYKKLSEYIDEYWGNL